MVSPNGTPNPQFLPWGNNKNKPSLSNNTHHHLSALNMNNVLLDDYLFKSTISGDEFPPFHHQNLSSSSTLSSSLLLGNLTNSSDIIGDDGKDKGFLGKGFLGCHHPNDHQQNLSSSSSSTFSSLLLGNFTKSSDIIDDYKGFLECHHPNDHHQNLSSSSSSTLSSLLKSKDIIDDDGKDKAFLGCHHSNDHDHQQGNMTTTTTALSLQDVLVSMETENQIIIDDQPIMTSAVIDPIAAVSQQQQPQADWLQFQLASVQDQEHMTTMAESSYPISEYEQKSVLDVGHSENKVAMPNSAIPLVASATTRNIMKKTASVPALKRRRLDDTMEKSIEKRRNRMMKNRESAARSRAKKQVSFLL